MTLDESIKHFEELTERWAKEGSLNQESFMPLDEFMRYHVECLERASECKQIVEWLRELKGYRKVRRILSQNRIATDSYGEVVLWSDIKRVLEEVNADEKEN